MKSFLLLTIWLSVALISYSQISEDPGLYIVAKEYSKEIALYKAKEYVMNEIIRVETSLIKFEIDPLAAASSGELTSLVYSCKEKQLGGLILGFYGDRWNESGVIFKAYAFKNLPQSMALEILDKIENITKEHSKYLNADDDVNNIFFKYDDMTFLIYNDELSTKIRVFWNGFDSEWESQAFGRTKKRFEKNIKN